MPEYGYCMKCHEKREMVDPREVTTKSKRGTRSALVGKCKVCGTKISRFIKSKAKKGGGSRRSRSAPRSRRSRR